MKKRPDPIHEVQVCKIFDIFCTKNLILYEFIQNVESDYDHNLASS